MTGFVPYKQREGYVLNGVPRAHMRQLSALAKERNTSLTNVAGEMLADCLGIEFEPSDRSKQRSNRDARSLYLMLPTDLMEWIRLEAEKESVTIRSVILGCLSETLGLKAPKPTHVDPGKRPGRPKGR